MNEGELNPEEFQEFLQRMLSGSGIDPQQISDLLAGADPAMLQAVIGPIMAGGGPAAMFSQNPWDDARKQALQTSAEGGVDVSPATNSRFQQAVGLANLWLSEATTLSEPTEAVHMLSRNQWVAQTLPVWQEIAAPVSTSIADALTDALQTQVPEEMQSMVQGASTMMRNLGAALFAAQFGQVIGNLSREVLSGADVGVPVMTAGTAALVPQNIADFGDGLEIPADQIEIYLVTRELAYARLYRQAKWLRLHVLAQIQEFAQGIHVDVQALEDVASRLDPTNPQELKDALESGALLPAQTPAQREALHRLETLIALIDGWVDAVTETATARLPEAARIAESARRRRAAGGPAEDALGALVGLHIRPRRLREAAQMWREITAAVGVELRDTLWDYPDLIPTSEDIDQPQLLIHRLQATARGELPPVDEFDQALARLLDGDDFAQPAESASAEDAASAKDVASAANPDDPANPGDTADPADPAGGTGPDSTPPNA